MRKKREQSEMPQNAIKCHIAKLYVKKTMTFSTLGDIVSIS